MRNSLFKKADKFHPEEGFYRGKKFQKAPEPKYKDGTSVLVDGKQGRIQTSYNGADEGEPTYWLYAIRWPDGSLSHRGYGEDEIEVLPEFSADDQKFLKDFRISGHLRKKIQAAYMNGYAEHASKWIREHGDVTRGSETYAEQNGLRPEYFKEAIHTMRRYARLKKAYTLTNEGMGASVCPKCNQPIKDNEMINWTAQGQEAHISCPVDAVDTPTPATVPQTPEIPQTEIPTQSYYASKQAAQYIDDEWREVLVANGWYPHSVYANGQEIEQWRKQGMDFSVVISIDVNTEEPFFGIYDKDGKYVDGSNETWALEIYTSDNIVLKEPDAPVKHERELNDEDKSLLKSMGIKAKKAADPKWVGWVAPPKSKSEKKWEMGGPLEKKQPSTMPYAGNNPHTPTNRRPKMEPPVYDTPEFAKAVSNLMIMHKKRAVGAYFAVVFPDQIMQVAPEIVKDFRAELKKWMKKKQWGDQFTMKIKDSAVIVERVKAPWEGDQPVYRMPGETEEYLDERIEDLIQVPVNWLYRINFKGASLKIAHEHSLTVPMSSAAHVAHHLATAGLLDFEVETDEEAEESYFIFESHAELEAAHEIIRHAFKAQIESGKGEWAEWKQLETAPSMDEKPGRAMASKRAGAWGERSYDNDYVHDILDRYRPKGNQGRGFDEPIPAEKVKPLLDEMLLMVDNAHTPDDQARFFGVMIFLFTHGVKLPPQMKGLTIEIGRELAGNEEYLKQWRNPTARKVQLKRELHMLGDPMKLVAAESEDDPMSKIVDEMGPGFRQTYDQIGEWMKGKEVLRFKAEAADKVRKFFEEDGVHDPKISIFGQFATMEIPIYNLDFYLDMFAKYIKEPVQLKTDSGWQTFTFNHENPWAGVQPVPEKKPSLLKRLFRRGSEEDDSQFHDIADPVCLCTHTFHDHERKCDRCDCPGFDPAPMPKQVEYVCERRSFGRVGKGANPMTFERDKNDRILKVYFDGDRVSKVEFYGKKGDKPDTREGWDGFFSFTQTFGD